MMNNKSIKFENTEYKNANDILKQASKSNVPDNSDAKPITEMEGNVNEVSKM